MIAPLIAQQQSLLATNNMAVAQMMMGSNAMLSNVINDFIKDYPYLFRKIAFT